MEERMEVYLQKITIITPYKNIKRTIKKSIVSYKNNQIIIYDMLDVLTYIKCI